MGNVRIKHSLSLAIGQNSKKNHMYIKMENVRISRRLWRSWSPTIKIITKPNSSFFFLFSKRKKKNKERKRILKYCEVLFKGWGRERITHGRFV